MSTPSDNAQPLHFVITSVPATNSSVDGQTITVRVQNARGEQIDLSAHYAVLEDVANALNEASARAHRARRMVTTVDESGSIGEIEPTTITGYRFSVEDGKSALLLQLQTSTGRTDMLLQRADADAFVKEAQQHLELLRAPRQTN